MSRAQRRAVERSNRRRLRSGAGWGEWAEAGPDDFAAARDQHPISRHCSRAWRCRRFVVIEFVVETAWGAVLHLHVNPVDGGGAPRWAEMQRVKDELVGHERVAVEVYPARSNLVDQADAYHLWVLPEGMELPFGLHEGGYAP